MCKGSRGQEWPSFAASVYCARCQFQVCRLSNWCFACNSAGRDSWREEPLAVESDEQNISIAMGNSAVSRVAPVSPPPFQADSKTQYVQSKLAKFGSQSTMWQQFSLLKLQWVNHRGIIKLNIVPNAPLHCAIIFIIYHAKHSSILIWIQETLRKIFLC